MTATHQTSPEQKPDVCEMRRLDTLGSLELLEALRRENHQLRTALGTRIVIEQAKGTLAERLRVEVDEAFERLRREARNRRMKLHALAAAVVAREAWTEAIFRVGEASDAADGAAVVRGVAQGLGASRRG
jgi:hypothetical protein